MIARNSEYDYSIFAVDAEKIATNDSVIIKTAREIDSFHWINQVGFSNKIDGIVPKNRQITLKVIKRGSTFFYVVDGIYYDSESLPKMEDKNYVGFYTTSGMVIDNFDFTDYSNNLEEIDEMISEYVYSVKTPTKSARGSVYLNNTTIKRGSEATLYIRPNYGYVLTGLSLNGDSSFYNTVVNNINEYAEYTFTPTSDVEITCTFSPIPKEMLVDSTISLKDEKGISIIDATYSIFASNPLFYLTGIPNSRGNVVTKLVKKGSFNVEGREFNFDGNYEVKVNSKDYSSISSKFLLDDNTSSTSLEGVEQTVNKDHKYTLIVVSPENEFGKIKVNGKTPSCYGTLQKDSDGSYYVENNTVFTYFRNMIGSNQMVHVKMEFSNLTNNESKNPISGLAITSGNYCIVFKINKEHSTSRMILATGSESNMTTSELALSGISSSIGSSGGTFEFTVIRYQNVFYFVDVNGILKFTIDSENGITLKNGTDRGWGWDSNTSQQQKSVFEKLIKQGNESAFGVVSYNESGKVSWTFDYSDNVNLIKEKVEQLLAYKNIYNEHSWIADNASNYKSWVEKSDGLFIGTNPGTGGCYTAYISKEIEESSSFKYIVKINAEDITKTYAGIGCYSVNHNLFSGVSIRVVDGITVLENIRFDSPYGSMDWPYIELGNIECVNDGEFYFAIEHTGTIDKYYLGNTKDSLELVYTSTDSNFGFAYDSFIPGMFIRGVVNNSLKVTFSNVEYSSLA